MLPWRPSFLHDVGLSSVHAILWFLSRYATSNLSACLADFAFVLVLIGVPALSNQVVGTYMFSTKCGREKTAVSLVLIPGASQTFLQPPRFLASVPPTCLPPLKSYSHPGVCIFFSSSNSRTWETTTGNFILTCSWTEYLKFSGSGFAKSSFSVFRWHVMHPFSYFKFINCSAIINGLLILLKG